MFHSASDLTCAPMGYSQNLHADGRDVSPPPPTAICQTNGPILDLKTAFDIPGLELSENFPVVLRDEDVAAGH